MSNLRFFFDKYGAKLRAKKDLVIRPVLVLLKKLRISPFEVSLMALILGLAAVYFFPSNKNLYLALILLSVFCDFLDGGLARLEGKASSFGFWTDFFVDRFIVFALMISVYLQNSPHTNQLIYLLAPLLFVTETVIYIFVKKRIFNVTLRTMYLVVMYFNPFYATVIALCTDVINLFIFYASYFVGSRQK